MSSNISQNLQENTCARVSFFNKVAGLWHRCFAVNFAKFPRTLFLTEHLRRLLLEILSLNYAQNPIVAQININSTRNKFELLVPQIASNINVLTISETKMDDSFPTSQFLTDGFSSSYRLDRNSNGGGILVYFKNDFITKSLKTINLSIETTFIEMNFKKKMVVVLYL